MYNAKISDLVGKVVLKIDKSDDELIFYCSNGEMFRMYHSQDCCESVHIDDICGDLKDLVGSNILKAEQVSNDAFEDAFDSSHCDSYTWTFYKLATIKGYVDIRWFGESNGYYSESVDFEKSGFDINLLRAGKLKRILDEI